MQQLNQRLEIINQEIIDNGYDVVIVSNPGAISYYLDIEFDPMERLWLLILQPNQSPQLIANELFVFDEIPGIDVTWVKDTHTVVEAFDNLKNFPDQDAVFNVGVDQHWMAGQLIPVMNHYAQANFTLGSHLIDNQRAVKSAEEQTLMRVASEINDRAMARLIAEVLPLGLSELEAVDELARLYKEEGADSGFSFTPIIAYGANGADPHHEPDHTKPKHGDSVIIDIGCKHQDYCSDMTRTVFYGEPSDLSREIYEIVLQANLNGIAAATVGTAFADVDAACRDHITQKGYGAQFTHRTGHFIGREVHEKGDVSGANYALIKAGNIFSIEPGIYIKGNTAVRIEDLIIAQEEQPEVINHYTKDLHIIQPRT